MIYIVLIISFILDAVVSNIVSMHSIFLPLFTVISFIIIYPYFRNDFKYYIYLAIVGILYDIAYGDIYLLNLILFCITGVFIHFIHHFFENNYLTYTLELVIVIVFFRTITYIVSIILGNNFNAFLLFEGIYRSLILNIIYGLILYYIDYLITRKRNLITS